MTYIILSTRWATSLRVIASVVDVRTMWTFGGRCCRNNSQKKESRTTALFLSNCCKQCNNWEGLPSPSSSVLSNFWSCHHSEAAVHLFSWDVIKLFIWWHQNEIVNFVGDLRGEGSDNVFKFCQIYGATSGWWSALLLAKTKPEGQWATKQGFSSLTHGCAGLWGTAR